MRGVPISNKMVWAGRIMSAVPALLVLFASVVKFMKAPAVVQGMAHVGFSEHLILPVAVIELLCVVVYLIPLTSVLGAILMTGLLGAATALNVGVGDPSYPIPIVLGMLVWG